MVRVKEGARMVRRRKPYSVKIRLEPELHSRLIEMATEQKRSLGNMAYVILREGAEKKVYQSIDDIINSTRFDTAPSLTAASSKELQQKDGRKEMPAKKGAKKAREGAVA